MGEEYNSPGSKRRLSGKGSDPLSRLSDISSGSSFNSAGGGSNPGSPRLLPRRPRQNYMPVGSVTKSPILGSGNSSPFHHPTTGSSYHHSPPLPRPPSASSLTMMDMENDDFVSGIYSQDSGVSGNFSTDSGHFNNVWEHHSFSPSRNGQYHHHQQQRSWSGDKPDVNWQEKCLGLQLELHRFKHQATQVKDVLQDKVS